MMRHGYFSFRSFLFAIAFSLPLCVSATSILDTLPAPRLMLKVSVGELLGSQYSKIHLGAAVRITPQHYVEVGGGSLIAFGIGRNQVNWETFSGFAFDASYRYFTAPAGLSGYRPIFWMSAGPAYQQLNATIGGDFWRQEENYFQRMSYEVTDKRIGGQVGAGFMGILGRNVVFEFGLNVFLFDHQESFSQLPEDVVFQANGSQYWHYAHNPKAHDFGGKVSFLVKIGWAFH